jgi:O-antigen/teichoic acid export membrane protein
VSRLKKYTHSMLSSYALMGVNVVYTLVSMPMALSYLSKAEFGLWALTLQVVGYIALLDLGMSSSISRILIDHKDDRTSGKYGGAIQSSFLVGLAQGAISLVVGLSLVWFMADWLRVPAELRHSFLILMAGQVFLTAATFFTRVFSQILFAWQRIDLSNYSAMIQLAVGLGALWLGFHFGWGVYSLLIGAVAGWASGVLITGVFCLRLGFLPEHGLWGRATRSQVRELFHYGADVFLIGMGTQLIMASQTVVITRQLGLDVAAVWSVMTKVFTLLSQVVWRFISNAMPAFAEMFVRGERDRLWDRYRTLFIVVSMMATFCAVIFAACNNPFVAIWMKGAFTWPMVNNVLLAAWLLLLTQQCCHSSLIMCLKEIRELRFVYIAEGFVFIVGALLVLPRWGMTGMLLCSVAATILFTWSWSNVRVARLPGGSARMVLWQWQIPSLKLVAVMLPIWIGLEWAFGTTSHWLSLDVWLRPVSPSPGISSSSSVTRCQFDAEGFCH